MVSVQTHVVRPSLLRLGLVSIVTAGALFTGPSVAVAQEHQGRRARLSEDLRQRLREGDSLATTVILTGSQARVDDVATRHGLRIRKRLRSGAVLEVPAHRLAAVASDDTVDQLSGNHVVGAQMAVTLQSVGADAVQEGIAALGVRGVTGAGVGIAVIDSGVASVPELRGRIVASLDFTDDR
jgi:hypothetical protein